MIYFPHNMGELAPEQGVFPHQSFGKEQVL